MAKGDMNSLEFRNTAMKWSVIAGVVLLLGVAAAGTYYTSTSKDKIVDNKNSIERMTSLDVAMRSIMGPKLPFILLTMIILVGMILFGLYLGSKGNGINITLSDGYAHTLNVIFTVFVLIFGVVMVVLSYHESKRSQTDQEMGHLTTYEPSVRQRVTNLLMALIIGGTMFILIGGGLLVWYLFLGGKQQMERKK